MKSTDKILLTIGIIVLIGASIAYAMQSIAIVDYTTTEINNYTESYMLFNCSLSLYLTSTDQIYNSSRNTWTQINGTLEREVIDSYHKGNGLVVVCNTTTQVHYTYYKNIPRYKTWL